MPKIKQRKPKELIKLVKDNNLTSIFNQMLGVESADPKIISPKYEKCKKLVYILCGFLDKFANGKIMLSKFPEEKINLQNISNFANELKAILDDKPINHKYDSEEVSKIYLKFKNENAIKTLYMIHSHIKLYKNNIGDIEKLNDKFITEAVGYEIYPLKQISSLNLYNIWAKEPDDKVKTYILKFLFHVYKNTKLICEILMEADIDIKEFSNILIMCISQAKKQIPRCDDAFRRIENAVELLSDNFNGYYKDFVQSENPGIIFENFIVDVSKEQKGNNMKLVHQFKRIVGYFKKSISQINDPEIKGVMKMINSRLSSVDDMDSDNDNDIDDTTESVCDNDIKENSQSLMHEPKIEIEDENEENNEDDKKEIVIKKN